MTKENNTGDCNTGYCNTGDRNSGNRNSGNCNSGDWNSGNWNSGDWNSGKRNSGNWNSGNWNSGNWNSGNWNSGNWNSGNCNSIEPSEILVFNKMCKVSDWHNAEKPNWMYVSLCLWVGESDMSDKEKDAYPSYATTGGYLKCYNSLHDAFKEAWDKAPREDKLLTFDLPNFDAKVFEEVFGFYPEKPE